jgi:hypothetical protein
MASSAGWAGVRGGTPERSALLPVIKSVVPNDEFDLMLKTSKRRTRICNPEA